MPAPRTRSRQVSHFSGGSRAGGGQRAIPVTVANAIANPDDYKPRVRTLEGVVARDATTRACPTCGLEVPVRKNGSLRTHRVRNAFKQSWPCKGEDEGTP